MLSSSVGQAGSAGVNASREQPSTREKQEAVGKYRGSFVSQVIQLGATFLRVAQRSPLDLGSGHPEVMCSLKHVISPASPSMSPSPSADPLLEGRGHPNLCLGVYFRGPSLVQLPLPYSI